MKTTKTLVLAVVVAASAALATSARAGEGPYGGCRGGEWGSYFDHVGSFCKEHGVKFSHGYFYPGLVQKHFTRKWHNPHFKTDLYFDPHAHCPYYWCEGHGVWYPIHYIEQVGPGAKGPGPVVGGAKGGPIVGGPVGDAPIGGGVVGGVGGAAIGGAGAPGAPVGEGAAAGPAGAAPAKGAAGAGAAAPGAAKKDAPAGGAAPGAAAAGQPAPQSAQAPTQDKEIKQAKSGTFDDEILN